jgi:hypothetical protein
VLAREAHSHGIYNKEQPDDSAYEYGDVLNGINNACAITFQLYLVISLSVFLSLHN